jgi:hypothetical protein
MNDSGDIVVSVAGDGTSTCSLIGSTNVQGRFTNGSPQPCYTPASSNNGRFIHAEQLRRVRDNYEIYSKFIDAINQAIDTVTSAGPNEVPKAPGLYLSIPWPNPSASAIQLYLSSSRAQQVTVELFDVSGARVATIYRGSLLENGLVNLTLQSDRFSSGVYFVRATGINATATRKVILMH